MPFPWNLCPPLRSARLSGIHESSVREWVTGKRQHKELCTVEIQGWSLIPTVQLTNTGENYPLISELLRPLLTSGLDGWVLWAWLESPTGWLSGDVPAEVAKTNIRRARIAAERNAAELQQARDNVE